MPEASAKKEEVVGDKTITDLEAKFTKAEQAHREIRTGGFSWDDRESLFFGKYKHPGEKTKSVLSTGELATIAIDGSCRVMAQLPSGRFYNFNGKVGSNMAMNLLFEHYVIPNATSGGELLVKDRMVNMYSRVFPAIPVFIPWEVRENYVGPDMIVIHPRRFFPQPGKVAIQDMDYCFFETEMSREFLQSADKEFWKNTDKVLANDSSEGTGTPEVSRSVRERGKTQSGITVRHYLSKKGDWKVWAVNARELLLDEKKYFTCLPIAVKQQYPVMDSIWAYNDFDRGEGTQKSIDSVVRMFADGMAMTIKPPKMVDKNKAVVSSVVMEPDAMWFGEAGSVQIQNVSPQGLNMVQGMWGMLKGNLLSMGASQDTSVSKTIDTGMGRTPEAIRAQGDKQGARDAWDSFMQKTFNERVYTIMADMIAYKGVEPFAFQLLGTSIEKIKEQYPEEDFENFIAVDDETGEITIENEILKGNYRYIQDPGSTELKKDDTGEKMMGFVETYNKYPGIAEDFAVGKMKFNQGEAFKRAVLDSGVQDSEKIIVKQEENPEAIDGIGADGATVIDPATGQPVPPEATEAQEMAQIKQDVAQIGQAVGMIMRQMGIQPPGAPAPIDPNTGQPVITQ